ncbi:MAG: helix-turn-helix domain-containing protein [Acidobacteriota bacterium]
MPAEKRHPETRAAPTFGEILRRERQLRNISLREVSGSTKISIRHLEALERNDFAALPGGAFNKGFLRAFAAFIGLDPEAMVNHYLFELRRQGQQPAPESPPTAGMAHRRRMGHLLLAGGILLLLALMALVLSWGAGWIGP